MAPMAVDCTDFGVALAVEPILVGWWEKTAEVAPDRIPTSNLFWIRGDFYVY